MSWLHISQVLTFIVSLSMTYGLYAQAVKIWKTKSAKDFALVLVISVVANEIVWLNYGIVLRQWPIIGLGIINVPCVIAICILFFKYRDGQDLSTKGD